MTPGYGSVVPPADMVLVQDGPTVKVGLTYSSGHQNTWYSSEGFRNSKGARVNTVNVMLLVYIFLSGLHFGTVKVPCIFILLSLFPNI